MVSGPWKYIMGVHYFKLLAKIFITLLYLHSSLIEELCLKLYFLLNSLHYLNWKFLVCLLKINIFSGRGIIWPSKQKSRHRQKYLWFWTSPDLWSQFQESYATQSETLSQKKTAPQRLIFSLLLTKYWFWVNFQRKNFKHAIIFEKSLDQNSKSRKATKNMWKSYLEWVVKYSEHKEYFIWRYVLVLIVCCWGWLHVSVRASRGQRHRSPRAAFVDGCESPVGS